MAEYRYYLIPDAMTRAFPEKFEKQTPTEFFDNIADLEKRYHQLREMPYNNERTWNERARFPYARLVVGVDRQNPDGAVEIIQVRNGVNYLCDDYRGPYADGSDAQIPQMAKKLVEVIGVDRVRPHTYTQRDGYTWVQVEKDMHITEWLYAHELCSSLQFTRFLNRDGRELFQVRDGQRVIETNADGTKRIRAVKNIDVTHAYVGHYGCHIQQYAEDNFRTGCYVAPEHPQPGDNLDKLQIYQITKGGCEYRFMNYAYSKSRIHAADYSSVYIANLPADYDLDRCFQEFNAPNRPLRYHMCSLSTSDIVVTTKNGKETAYDKTANGGKNMRLICARSKMFKKKDAARALNGIPCPAPYASEWKLELMAREVFRTVWKENAEDILGLLRMLDANLNTTGTPNDGNQLENKLSALNEELDDLVSQRASRSITMDDFLSKSTEINNEIINVEGLLQSSIQEQRPKARLDMHSIEAALSDDASFPDGKIEPGFLDRYANRIVKSNNRYIWMLQLMNVQQIMPIQSERQPIAMVTYKSGVPYDIEQEQIGKQDKESAGPDCATICRPQDFFLDMSRTKRKRKLVEWLESCQENQVSVLDEKIPLLSFAVDFVTAYEYQKARGIKIHPGLWKDMRVDIFLVKKEN